MRKNWPLKVLLALIFAACLSGAYGYSPESSTASPLPIQDFDPDQSSVSQYSDYYTIPASPYQGTHILEPEEFELEGETPTTLYYGNQQQSVPYSSYQALAATTGNSLWIQGSTSWSQYAVVPQGAFLSLIAITPGGGLGYLNEIYPDGRSVSYSYQFYPLNRLGFYADKIGRHILSLMVNGMSSNPVVIDVIAYTPPPYTRPIYYIPAFDYYHRLFNACPDDRRFCYGNCCPQGYIWKDCRCQPSCPPGKKCGDKCCKQGEVCLDGQCKPSCPPDKKCGDKCCKQGEVCLDGQCKPSCPPDKKCGDRCCKQGEVCIDGQCKPSCPQDKKCGDRCCKQGEVCIEGQCKSSCPQDKKCGDRCCKQGEVCIEGQCKPSCPQDKKCDEKCCAEDQECIGGECKYPAPETCSEGYPCGEGKVCIGGECKEDVQATINAVPGTAETAKSAWEIDANPSLTCPSGQQCGTQCCRDGETCAGDRCQSTFSSPCLDREKCDEQMLEGSDLQEWPEEDPFGVDSNRPRRWGWENQLAPLEASE